ncbi:hypothetical protein BDM02DRAFT_1857279 [Thelephora ganbajun]|uniref:Uncharacterized protein n=1 Tax=Thelephora ganbajun TaxID=370292 RepID=A0ACB6YZK5_THEGA|nr:hypothetical protein BDM02DRAFT_1857279 [Thelephora ganbajun]
MGGLEGICNRMFVGKRTPSGYRSMEPRIPPWRSRWKLKDRFRVSHGNQHQRLEERTSPIGVETATSPAMYLSRRGCVKGCQQYKDVPASSTVACEVLALNRDPCVIQLQVSRASESAVMVNGLSATSVSAFSEYRRSSPNLPSTLDTQHC